MSFEAHCDLLVSDGAAAESKEGRRNELVKCLPLTDRPSHGVALEGRRSQAYDEEAFRYFLAIERKRSERSGRPFLLLLVDLKEQPGVGARIHPAVAGKLFSGLWLQLRDSDFVGWYREERVAGAVLTELGDGPRADVSHAFGQRVTQALCARLPADLASRLRVRAYHHAEPERPQARSGLRSVLDPDMPLAAGLS
ncbi:MAG: hypothetical protein DMF98_17590 [Acidobacteria bacterium]|nr:MAG: hypothetical protein DMF98_17590 [Acidobacteriota bacterium]